MSSHKEAAAEEMAEYFLESRNDDTNDNVEYCEKKNLKPHAQAHLLSSTESCKVIPNQNNKCKSPYSVLSLSCLQDKDNETEKLRLS